MRTVKYNIKPVYYNNINKTQIDMVVTLTRSSSIADKPRDAFA